MVGVVNITTLSNRQYCVVLDPVGSDGKPQLGQKKLVKGERSFFLLPGERLEKGIQNVYILGEDEGLILKATETFRDVDTVSFGVEGKLRGVCCVDVRLVHMHTHTRTHRETIVCRETAG